MVRFNRMMEDLQAMVPELDKTSQRRLVHVFGFLSLVLVVVVVALGVAVGCVYRRSVNAAAGPSAAGRLRAAAGAAAAEDVCRSAPCVQAAATVARKMNRQVAPCEDFYRFACGGWNTRVPWDQVAWHVKSQLEKSNSEKQADVLRQPIRSQFAYERKIKHFFRSCTDEVERSRAGSLELSRMIRKQIPGSFLLEGSTNESRFDRQESLVRCHTHMLTPVFFSYNVVADPRNHRNSIIYIVPGDVSQATVGHREVVDPLEIETVKVAYEKYIRQVGGLFMRDSRLALDNDTAHDRLRQFVEDVVRQELQVLKILREHGNFRSRNEEPETEIKKLKDFAKEFKAIDWMKIVQTIFAKVPVTGDHFVRVGMSGALRQFDQLLLREGPDADRIMNNYITWGILQSYIEYLPWEYRMARYDMQYEVLGVPTQPSAGETCLGLTKYHLGYAFLAEFGKTHIGRNTIDRIEEVFKRLKATLSGRLELVDWMDDATRRLARQRLDAMTEILVYPKLLRDERAVDSMYRNLVINPSKSFLWNLLSTNKFMWELMTVQLLGEYQLGLWQQVIMSDDFGTWVNYYQHQNALLVPPGILQLPFFSPIFPDALVYGTIGAEMARYMSRSIDAEGSGFYNETTAARWYTDKATRGINRQKKCLADYYAKRPMKVKYMGQEREIDFRTTRQHTHIRDTAQRITGIRAGYHAYRNLPAETKPEIRLPALDLTSKQVYFVSTVQTNCEVWRPDLLYQLNLRSQFKVPSMKYILNGVLSNTPEFAEAFQCPPDSPMKEEQPCLFL